MQVPSPEDFRRQSGMEVMPPWVAPVADAGCDLYVPDAGDEPDEDALEFARRVLPRLDVLRDDAVRYIAHAVQPRGFRMDAEAPAVDGVFCEAGSGTVILEMCWDADLYNLWHVTFHDHPIYGLRPQAFGCRASGSSIPPWRPPSPPL